MTLQQQYVKDHQQLLEKSTALYPACDPGGADGFYGANTEAAALAAENAWREFRLSKGVMPDDYRTGEPLWLTEARKYIGEKEVRGTKNHPLATRMWELIKAPFRTDETPWCAGYVGACLERVGILSSRSAAARSYMGWGKACDPVPGAVVVFWRGKRNGWSGHVGFVTGKDKDGNIMVLGGNQGNAVNIRPFSRSRVLGYRWPVGEPYPHEAALPILASNGKLSTNEA